MVRVSSLYFMLMLVIFNFHRFTFGIYNPVLINAFIGDLYFGWPLKNINIIHGKINGSDLLIQSKLSSLAAGVSRSFITSSFSNYTPVKTSNIYSAQINNIILCDTVLLTELLQMVYLNENWKNWFFVTSLSTPELKLVLANANLEYNSLVYVAQINENDSITISEWYKLSPQLEVIVSKIATWEGPGKYNFNRSHIWVRRKNLGGLHFVASVSHHPPLVYVNNTRQGHAAVVTGLLPHLWNELGKELNFTTEYIETTTFVEGFKSVRKLNSDILLDLVLQNKQLSYVDNTVPIMKMSFFLYQRRPDLSNYWLAYVRPFSGVVWALVAITLLIMPAVMTLVYLVYHNVGDNEDGDVLEFIDAFFITFGSFVQQSSEYLPRSLAVRQIFWFSFVLGVLLYTAYSAELISNLTIPKLVLPLHNLKDVVYSKAHVTIVKESGLHMYIQNSNLTLLNELHKRIIKNKGLVEDITRGLQQVSEKGSVLLDAHEYVQPLLRELGCRISYPDIPVVTFPMSFGLRRNFPYKQSINYFLKRMIEAGLLQQSKKFWYNYPDQYCSDKNFISMGFEHISSIFIFWFIGLFIACIIFVLEKIIKKVKMDIEVNKTENFGIDQNSSEDKKYFNWSIERVELRKDLKNENIQVNLPFIN